MRKITVSLSLSEKLIDQINQQRGLIPKSAFIEDIILKYFKEIEIGN